MLSIPAPATTATTTTPRVDRRGHARKLEVANGTFVSPSGHCRTWEASAQRMEAAIKQMGLEEHLRHPDFHGGGTRRSIFMHLLMCEANKSVVLERSAGSDASFFGIQRFRIVDQEAFDSGADEIGVIHSVQWAKKESRSVQMKTVKKHWSDAGFKDKDAVYTFVPFLAEKYKASLERDAKKRQNVGATPPLMQPIAAVGPVVPSFAAAGSAAVVAFARAPDNATMLLPVVQAFPIITIGVSPLDALADVASAAVPLPAPQEASLIVHMAQKEKRPRDEIVAECAHKLFGIATTLRVHASRLPDGDERKGAMSLEAGRLSRQVNMLKSLV
jgi:hypothetical protein